MLRPTAIEKILLLTVKKVFAREDIAFDGGDCDASVRRYELNFDGLSNI